MRSRAYPRAAASALHGLCGYSWPEADPVVRLATAAALHRGMSGSAVAQPDYPSRPIRIVVPSGPGSAPDLIPRLLGEPLTARWGQPIVIEHRPGAGGNLGAEFVFKATPDGYTLLSTWSSPLVVNQSLYAKLNYDPAAFAVIAVIATSPNVLVVHPKVPAASLARAHRLRQGESRQAHLRFGRHRRHAASGDGDAEIRRRHRDQAHPLQSRTRARDHRHARRPGRHGVRQSRRCPHAYRQRLA